MYMQEIIDWLSENREWVFSGIGITVLTSVMAIAKSILGKRKKSDSTIIVKQINKGKHNTQIGIQNNYKTKENGNE